MKIYSGPLSMFGAKVEIAAREKGIPFELEMVPFSMEKLYAPKHPEVLRINPKRQVPVLIDGDLEIFDSTQIFEYLEDRYPVPPLWPAAPQDRARARLLELKSDEVFFPPVIRLMGLSELARRHRGLLRGYRRAPRRPRLPRRPVHVRRYRLLHGPVLRRPNARADDRGASAPLGMAAAHVDAARRGGGRRRDEQLPAERRSSRPGMVVRLTAHVQSGTVMPVT
jgi:hypothetical protein